jgi:phosphoglycolate phosphatase-like HAD superfamily hydrolase
VTGFHGAVIFDVDGVLLDLTPAEEDAFFAPFETLYGLTGLSRDWDSYRVRNDEDIIGEILERQAGRPPGTDEMSRHMAAYCTHLENGYRCGTLRVEAIPGAHQLLDILARRPGLALGTATANVLRAAEVRLIEQGLWDQVSGFTCGADGGGHKREILARVIGRLALPPERIVYVGDNLNDLEAGEATGVHFIGFAVEPARRDRLAAAGARQVSGDHRTTLALIDAALGVL